MNSVSSKSQTEAVYLMLRADILSCRLRPGQKIKIRDEAERLGVSSSAVREALSRLSSDGLVISEPQRGFRAAPISAEHLIDLTDIRVEIESMCLRRAVANASVAWEGVLLSLNHRLTRTEMRASDDDKLLRDEWVAAHDEYHEAIVSTCDSPTLLQVRRQLYQQSERYRRLSVPLNVDERSLIDEHGAIVAALVARDAEKAIQLMSEHIISTTRILLEARVDGEALLPQIAA